MTRTAAAAALFLLLIAAGLRAELWSWTPADQPHHQACVKVRAGNAGGTGALIYSDGGRGLVLTAAHVVEHSRTASATWWATGQQSAGQIVAIDPDNDLALFEVTPPPDAVLLPIAAQAPPPGSACELLGFGGPTDHLRHFAGSSSRSNGGTLELQANLLNGDSGGPVVHAGELVGVIRGGPHQVDAGIIDAHGHRWPVVKPAWTTPPGPIRRLLQRACPGGYCGPPGLTLPGGRPGRPILPRGPATSPPPSTPIAPTTPTPPAPTEPPDVAAIAEAVLEKMAGDPRFKPQPVTVNVDAVAAALVEHIPQTIDMDQVADLVLAKMADDPRFRARPIDPERLADELPPLRFRWLLPDGTPATVDARLGQTVVLELPERSK